MTALNNSVEIEGFALLPQPKGYLFIRHNHLLVRLKNEDIQWINADGNYCYIQTESKKYAVRASMKKLTPRLAGQGFIQIHKSYIVRMDCIEALDLRDNLVKIGDAHLPLGRIYRERLVKTLDII